MFSCSIESLTAEAHMDHTQCSSAVDFAAASTQPDVHTPGAASYKRLLELYRAFHSHTNFKLAGVSWP